MKAAGQTKRSLEDAKNCSLEVVNNARQSTEQLQRRLAELQKEVKLYESLKSLMNLQSAYSFRIYKRRIHISQNSIGNIEKV